MHTLAISDIFIRTGLKKSCKLTEASFIKNRGKHNSHFKLDASIIAGVKAHINSIPRIESHYCRAQTKQDFIEGGYTIAALHRDYIEACKLESKDYVSYQNYYNIFVKDFNISFWVPKKDPCEDCVAFANAENKTPLREKYELHLKEKCLSRTEKE
ncbi:unnamed protein product [Parnassius apollo]|uniref:(apollo) hypothetical protein n=1 Tax=Parnassius apollo TaxID=110799 RepID=A0A8S3WIK9_PARAO|nr:unnamed protein product [Parnassius apollo]